MNLFKKKKKNKKGYVSEVDVEYLKKRRKNHNEFPFLAEQ